MIATSESIRTGKSGERMGRNVVRPRVTITSTRPASAFHRTPMQRVHHALSLRWGCKESTVQDRLNNGHSCFKACAEAVEGLLRFGCTEKLAECMSHVDASMLGENVPAAKDAMHEHKVADASEDVEQAEFERNPCAETWERWRMKLCREAYRIQDVIASHDEEYR
jgi:hypothetical protein